MLHVQMELILIIWKQHFWFLRKETCMLPGCWHKNLLPDIVLMGWWLDLLIIEVFFSLHSSRSLFLNLLCRRVTLGNIINIDSHGDNCSFHTHRLFSSSGCSNRFRSSDLIFLLVIPCRYEGSLQQSSVNNPTPKVAPLYVSGDCGMLSDHDNGQIHSSSVTQDSNPSVLLLSTKNISGLFKKAAWTINLLCASNYWLS